MDNLKKCYIILWCEELQGPSLSIVWLTPEQVAEGFQLRDQFIGDWVIFESLTQCEEILQTMRRECAA